MCDMIVLLFISMLLESAKPQTADAAADAAVSAPGSRERNQLKVATFNIRYGKAKDGDVSWDKRRGLFMRTVKSMDADVIGMQEVLAYQLDEIKAACPEYEFFGVGRNDGKRDGEFSPIGFRKDRFEQLAAGTIWLSETPEKVGSKGWDAALPRIATWARLRDTKSGQTFLFFATHFDHIGKEARANSAKLLRSKVDALRDGLPVIVVGDFNATEDEPPYANLLGREGDANRLLDSFREAHPKRGAGEGTFHGFKGDRDRNRIDWIVHTTDVKTLSCEIVHDSENGHYPSDHFPVAAVLEFAKGDRP
jgi:endonuclease/exonuclease/phosphatase family metal-dependent hydrolase